MQFSASIKNSLTEKSVFGQFNVIFLNVLKFSRDGVGFFLLLHSEKGFLNEKMSFLAGLKKKLSNFLRKYRFWPILATEVHIQSQFSQRAKKTSKNPRSASLKRLLRTLP